jgi:L-ascorbate metabolism protein UlaG (beta-lactamase superfamily)
MPSLKIRLLGWAGLQLDCEGSRLVIDPFADLGPFAAMANGPSPVLLPPEAPVDGALLTHLHRDHADAPTLAAALRPGAPVLCPQRAEGPGDENVTTPEEELAAAGLALRRVTVGDTAALGPFTVTAVDAVDGLGDLQVSWVVEAAGLRILHAGDTVWHGAWWRLAKTFGAFDAAFLPANGARVAFPWLSPAADVPAAMTPEQAVEAARALGARELVAIHHGVLEHRDFYRPHPDVPGAVAAAAARYDYPARVAVAGEEIEL